MTRRRRIALACAVLVAAQAAAVAIYLAVEHARTRKRSGGAPHPDDAAAVTLAGDAAPAIAARRAADDVPTSLADRRGGPVLVHFWGTWCAPCVDELPGLLGRAGAFTRELSLEVVAVAIDDTPATLRRFFGDAAIPPQVWLPDEPDIHRRFGASTLPDTYLIDADGRLLRRYQGARAWTSAAMRADLGRALGGP